MALADTLPGRPSPVGRVATRPDLQHQPTGVPGRLVLVGLLVFLACPLTLRSAWADWRYQSPVAELALVPVLAAAMALVASLRHPFVRTLRMGQADLWLGVILLGVVAMMEGWALVQPGSYLWVLRFDALALPLIATAVVVLLLGVRSLVVFWAPLLFLALAWPLPTAAAVELTSGPVTRLTSTLVQLSLAPLPWAPETVREGTDLLLHVDGLRGDVDVAVTSACSGLSGLLGFLVVGVAVLYLFDGRLRSRAAWLVAGLVLVLLLNVLRILGLVGVASFFGAHLALDVLHPVVGMVVLNVALVAMLLVAGRFGLVRRPIRPRASDNPLHAVGAPQPRRMRLILLRMAVLVVLTSQLGVLNLQMAQAAPSYRNAARSSIPSLSADLQDASEFGYATRSVTEQRWARRYFGADSRWNRFVLESPSAEIPTVWADVLDTTSLASLRMHSAMSCYRFHQQDVRSRRTVELGNGVLVETFVVEMSHGTWHVVTWQRPIERSGRVDHERVTLMASSREDAFASEYHQLAAPDGLRRRLVDGLNALRPGKDPNPALSRNLLALADELEAVGTSREAAS